MNAQSLYLFYNHCKIVNSRYNAIKWEQLHEEYKLIQNNKEIVDK